jgi:hypothetical protein
MKRFLLLIITCFSLLTYAQPSIDQELKVQVKLISELDETQLPPYCGIGLYYSTFEFEVVKVIKGEYKKSRIYIQFMCPREVVEFGDLKPNGTYVYRLRPLNSTDDGYSTEMKLYKKLD